MIDHIIHYISSRFKRPEIASTPFWMWIFIAGIGVIFALNSGYVSYPDEFVNLLGGKYILTGHIPYKDFWDHHMPFSWYLAAILLFFSNYSFVIFRLLWGLTMFAGLFGLERYIYKHYGQIHSFYLAYFFMYPFVSLYYWLHLYIGDAIAAFIFGLAFWMMIGETYFPQKTLRPLIATSMLICALLFSSMTFVYMAIGLYAWIGYLAWKRSGLMGLVQLAGISTIPYILYAIYLFASGSFGQFWDANVTYLTKIYVSLPNYHRGTHFNPLKLVLTILFNFYQGYIKAVVQIKELDIYFPVATTLAWGTFMLLLIFFFENKLIAVLFLMILSLSAARSNVASIPETDYQAGLYIILGMISGIVALWRSQFLHLKQEYFEIFRKVGIFLLFVYLLFSALFLVKNTYDKSYQRYTQVIPSIHNIHDMKTFVDEIMPESEKYTYWIGPYEPTEMYYLNVSQMPGPHPTLLAGFREDPYYMNTFIQQFEKSRPALIAYKHESSMFGAPADEFGAFFLEWMKKDYLYFHQTGEYNFLKTPSNVSVEHDLYVRKDLKDKVTQSLLEKGYISKK